jgi:leucyl-tRNA synthetase
MNSKGAGPSACSSMQRNWIGKSQGARVKFAVSRNRQAWALEVFTTRIDTIYGVSALVISAGIRNSTQLLAGVPGRALERS